LAPKSQKSLPDARQDAAAIVNAGSAMNYQCVGFYAKISLAKTPFILNYNHDI